LKRLNIDGTSDIIGTMKTWVPRKTMGPLILACGFETIRCETDSDGHLKKLKIEPITWMSKDETIPVLWKLTNEMNERMKNAELTIEELKKGAELTIEEAIGETKSVPPANTGVYVGPPMRTTIPTVADLKSKRGLAMDEMAAKMGTVPTSDKPAYGEVPIVTKTTPK